MTKTFENAVAEARGSIPCRRDIALEDMRELLVKSQSDPWEVISLAFSYGFTQGKRAAQKQAREA